MRHEPTVPRRQRVAVRCLVLLLGSFTLPVLGEVAAGSMDVTWNAGAIDCEKNPQPPVQVHRYNARTFILRENLCATYEGPFLYLLVGAERGLLIDTGAVSGAREMPLAQTVRALLPQPDFPLTVVHTHGHLDHRSGDGQFAGDAHTEVVGTTLEDVTRRFHFSAWPNGTAEINLGERVVDVLPTPGHYPSELSYYDRETGLFFSGDFFLPGRLLIADKSADLASARRVVQFLADKPVTYVLGGHVELDRAGNTFLGDHYHPNERRLPLSKEELLQLPAIVESFNGFYGRHGEYILENQNRVLAAAAAALVAVLTAAGFAIRALLRRRRTARLTGTSLGL
jgi:glyoxylase-like metal-dependent hydrolase (beta-lactamase superfamily II)